uniref:pollen-specific leucine-rich repeat extensin-like protein 3 n=1 Tax=Erigeron canadensis TaxID=72917 RepID=UPI001CB932F6|nr:pollen-specific leucine-rich repeat extensin-like protein 3 [Erigeron canadensis]
MDSRVFVLVILALLTTTPIEGMINRKLNDATTTVTKDDQIKCGGCPCNNPCYPTTASPPPPSPPPPSPPPAPKLPTPTPGLNCPPPPTTTTGGGYAFSPPEYIYTTGPPGNVYPTNPYFSGAHRNLWAGPPLLMIFGLLVSVVSIFSLR